MKIGIVLFNTKRKVRRARCWFTGHDIQYGERISVECYHSHKITPDYCDYCWHTGDKVRLEDDNLKGTATRINVWLVEHSSLYRRFNDWMFIHHPRRMPDWMEY